MDIINDESGYPVGEASKVFPELTLPVSEGAGHLFWDTLKGGLTKRELFAALAMQGLCACSHDKAIDLSGKDGADIAIVWADALIAKLAENE